MKDDLGVKVKCRRRGAGSVPRALGVMMESWITLVFLGLSSITTATIVSHCRLT